MNVRKWAMIVSLTDISLHRSGHRRFLPDDRNLVYLLLKSIEEREYEKDKE
jgi:hypothetical protein